jgi:glycosyltransferase involved in cell wall biosynthesis
MLVALLILVGLVAAFYLWMLAAPAQRSLPRFVYGTQSSPDVLNGAYPGDDVMWRAGADPKREDQWPSVTVIVPGRNEGHLLPRTLGSLCAMEYPRYRVVFVDDQSTDNTEAVCRELEAKFSHLTVIHNREHPRDGWIGKTWAVHQAEQYMHGSDYLLFADSDLEFHSHCLKQMVRLALHRRTDIASLLPSIRYETLGELLGLFCAMTIINTRLNLYDCNNPKVPRALVAGGFLLVKQEVYHELGGHAAVRGQVVEDVAFGTRAKALGKRVFTALTHDLYTARMYEGWLDTFRGLKKNAFAGANYSLPLGVLILGFLMFFGAMVPAYVAAGALLAATHVAPIGIALLVMALVAYLGQLWVGIRTARYVGFPVWTALLLPAGFLFYGCVFAGSMVEHYFGGNTWAGRRMGKVDRLAHAGKVG